MRRLSVLPLLVLLALPGAASASEISLTAPAPPLGEGSLRPTVTLTREDTSAPASVDVVAHGVSPADIDPVAQRVSFDPGQSRATFTLPIVEDDVAEPAEPVTLALANPSPGVTIDPTPVPVTLHDNDAEFVDTALVIPEGGLATIRLRRLDAFAQRVYRWGITGPRSGRVQLAPPFPLPLTVEFAGGQTELAVPLQMGQDNLARGTRSGTIDLYGIRPTGNIRRLAERSRLPVTLLDDEPAPPVPGPLRLVLESPRTRRLGREVPVVVRCEQVACEGTVELRLDPAVARRLRVSRILARRDVSQLAGAGQELELRVPLAVERRLRTRRRVLARVHVKVRDMTKPRSAPRRTSTRRIWLTR